MAIEKWTVFYEVKEAGTQPPLNYKEKDIKVEGKEKNAGLFKTIQSSISENSSKNFEASALISNNPMQCRFVTLEAEGASEAIKAVAKFYGQAVSVGKGMAALSANLEEFAPLP